MDQQKYLHNNLKFLRKRTKLTIAELLKILDLDISQNTFASYEDNRENTPKFELLKLLLDYYNEKLEIEVTYDDLHEKDLEEYGLNAFKKNKKASNNGTRAEESIKIDSDLTFSQNLELLKANTEYELAKAKRLEAESIIEVKKLDVELKKIELEIRKIELDFDKRGPVHEASEIINENTDSEETTKNAESENTNKESEPENFKQKEQKVSNKMIRKIEAEAKLNEAEAEKNKSILAIKQFDLYNSKE